MQKVLAGSVGKSCREMIDGILTDVKDFADTAEQSDDITLMALKRLT